MMETIRADLSGDGRRVVTPPSNAGYLGAPRPMTLGSIRRVVEAFRINESTRHSAAGHTLWAIQEWARVSDTPIKIQPVELDGKILGYICSLDHLALAFRKLDHSDDPVLKGDPNA